MKERPILFAGEMVRAILEGRKTQTRRIFKPFGKASFKEKLRRLCLNIGVFEAWKPYFTEGPYGKIGDRLWVRETHAIMSYDDKDVWYKASPVASPEWHDITLKNNGMRWKPSIHMPRWASRINLEITSIRVERVQDITFRGAVREGFPDIEESRYDIEDKPLLWFRHLWDNINEKRGYGWITNPWVWVVEFKVV